jgi:SAM-dependent methyltransferase
MSAIRNATKEYVLGNSIHEQERRKMQPKFLQHWSEQFFLSAGLEPGMRVLDLGCGMGDVSLLAAKLVEPSGRVTGIDRDRIVIEKARERIRYEGNDTQIRFLPTDLFFSQRLEFRCCCWALRVTLSTRSSCCVRHAAKQVRSEGIIFLHETDMANRIQCYPDRTLFAETYASIAETFRRSGNWPDLGLRLTRLFLDAGLPWPTIKAEVPVGGEPGSFIYRWLTETLRSILPRVEEYGLSRAQIDTLVTRMETEARIRQTQLIGPLQFGAWTKTAVRPRPKWALLYEAM